jgi:EmrB/QacA subfamily drug resistance transporter
MVASAPSDRRRWIALVVVCLGQLMIVLDTTIVNVALPAIQRDLHFSQANLTWVVNAYLITFGSFLLLAGRLGDLVGRKRVFLAGLALFTLASALCGLADSQGLLIAARFLQGLGGAVASSVILAIVVTEFPKPAEQAKAMSVFVFTAVGGGSIGLLAGGALTQSLDWHWIFFVNLPIGIGAFLLGAWLIDESAALGLREGVDVTGSILVTVAMMLGVYAIVTSSEHGLGSAHTLGFLGAAVALLAAFGALQARLANPIMPLRILRLRSLAGASAVRGLLVTGMFAAFFLGALYLERVRGDSAMAIGLAFLPQTLVVGALSTGITAWLMGRFGAMRTLIPGLGLMAVGLLLLTQAGVHTGYFPTVFLAFLLMGLGAGTSFMPLLRISMVDVPMADAGLASGIVNVSMQISAALGLAALGTIATDRTKALASAGHDAASALTGGFHLALGIGAACTIAGALLALLVLRPAAVAATAPAQAPAPAPAAAEPELEPVGA